MVKDSTRPQTRQRRSAQLLGRRYGDWLVVGHRGHYRTRWVVYAIACVRCHRRRTVPVYCLRRIEPCGCKGRRTTLPPIEGIAVDSWSPWEEDDRCWYVVHRHPEGLSHEQIGELMGLSASLVEQVERQALAKAREAFREMGYGQHEALEALLGAA